MIEDIAIMAVEAVLIWFAVALFYVWPYIFEPWRQWGPLHRVALGQFWPRLEMWGVGAWAYQQFFIRLESRGVEPSDE